MENFDQELTDHFSAQPGTDIDALAASMGVTLEKEPVLTKIPEADFAALDADATEAAKPPEEKAAKPGLQNAPDKGTPDFGAVGKGVATGTAQAVKNMYHGALDLTDFVSKHVSGWAGGGDEPLTGGARFTPDQLAKMRPPEAAPLEQRMAHMIAEYGLPVATGMGVGAGALRSMAVGAGIDFSMMDPNQERLATMLNDSYPELRDVAVVGNFIHWLGENNPEAQTELEGRFKNMIEGLGVGGAIAGAFNGAIKMSRAAKGYQKAAAGMPPVVEEITPAVKAVREAEEVTLAARNAEDAPPVRLRAETPQEKAMTAPLAEKAAAGDEVAKKQLQQSIEARVEPEPQFHIFDNNPTIKGVDGSTTLNLNNDILDEVLGAVDRMSPLYKPKTFEDYAYAARLAGMSEESGRYLANISEAIRAGRAPTPEETAFLAREVLPMADKNLEAAEALLESTKLMGKEDYRMAALNHKAMANRYAALTNVIDKGRSEAGAALNAQKLYQFAFEEADYVKHYAIVKSADGTEAVKETKAIPEIKRQMRMDKAERTMLQNMMIEKFGGGKAAEEYGDYVTSVSGYVADLPPGQAAIIREQYREAIKSGNLRKGADVLAEISRKAMLSSMKSPTAAVIGNFITTLNETATNYTTAITRSVTLDPMHKEAWHEANDFVKGLYAGFRAMTFNQGMAGAIDTTRFKKLEMRTSSISAAHWGIDGTTATGKSLEKVGMVAKYSPGLGLGETILGKVDQYFGSILEHAGLYQQAQKKIRLMEAQGLLKDIPTENLAREKTLLSQTSILAATSEEVKDARALAQAAVFAQDLPLGADGMRGATARGVNWMTQGPVRQFMFPFMRTGYNIMDYSVQHSVLGLFWDGFKGFNTIKAGGPEGAREFAKVMNGTMLVGAAAYLYSQGAITGPPPTNPRMRRALEESNKGWKPYSIKVGGEYVDYQQMEPLASMLRLGAMSYITGAYIGERDAQATMLLSGAALVDAFNPQNLTDELNNAFTMLEKADAVWNQGELKRVMNQAAGEQFGKFLPAAVKDTKRLKDDFKRDNKADDIITAVRNAWGTQVPWISEGYAVQRNLWGEPILEIDRLGPDMIIPMGSSTSADGSRLKTVLETMARAEIGKPDDEQFTKVQLAMPSRVMRFGDIAMQLTNEEYERYVLYTAGYMPDDSVTPGKEKPYTLPLRTAMEQMAIPIHDMLKGKEMSPMLYNAYKKEVTKVLTRYRKMARDMMLMDKEFSQRLQKAKTRAMESRNVGF